MQLSFTHTITRLISSFPSFITKGRMHLCLSPWQLLWSFVRLLTRLTAVSQKVLLADPECLRPLLQQFHSYSCSLNDLLWHTKHGIYRLYTVIPQQGQTCNPKQGVEGVHHIPGPVREPSCLLILTGQNELYQFVLKTVIEYHINNKLVFLKSLVSFELQTQILLL